MIFLLMYYSDSGNFKKIIFYMVV